MRSIGKKKRAGIASIVAALALLSTLPAIAQSTSRITLDEAIDLALKNSPSLKAARTQIDQNKAQEVTAGLRPNPILSWDLQYIPFFTPTLFSKDTLDAIQQFDIGAGYLIERGGKRHRRLDAARDQTRVTEAQVVDAERALKFSVAQQFISVLLAKSNLEFAREALKSFRGTVDINEERYKAGDVSKGDLLKAKIQLLQFQTDVTSAELARVQALASLRQLIGYEAVPRDFEVVGNLEYVPLKVRLDDVEATALRERPDVRAAQLGVNAAKSQLNLAKANGKQDLNVSFNYTHVSQVNDGALYFSIPLPMFNRNQGEIARSRYGVDQAALTSKAAGEAALTDVKNSFEAVQTNQEVIELYQSSYLKQSQESRDIAEFAYKQGAAALLDFLDAERSYRSTQLAYRQTLAGHMLAVEQLRQAVGVRPIP